MTAAPTTGLWGALAAFQAEAPTLPKDGRNPHFKSRFTTLDTIVETVQPLLAKHGLVWSTCPSQDDQGKPALRYTLAHASTGEVLTDAIPLMVSKATPQDLGSAITYARRYSITAVLNLVADEDDDGSQASRPTSNGNGATATPPAATPQLASASQRGLLNGKASEKGLSAADFAACILTAVGQEPREFDTPDQAMSWVNRSLDRLPAASVNPVLAEIEKR